MASERRLHLPKVLSPDVRQQTAAESTTAQEMARPSVIQCCRPLRTRFTQETDVSEKYPKACSTKVLVTICQHGGTQRISGLHL